MRVLRAIGGEFYKTLSLPAALVAVAIALLAPLGIALLAAVNNGRGGGAASPSDVVFSVLPLGTVGAVIFGVIVVSSEFAVNSPDAGGGRQISATLVAVPSRLTVFMSKAAVVIIVVSLTAAVTATAGLWLVHALVGSMGSSDDLLDMVTRSAGLALYWTCMALIAFAVTVLTRSGIVPLVWFIANSSVISVSLLLSKLTPTARYLPDLAGMRLFAAPSSIAVQDPLEPVIGGLVMTAWGLGLLIVSALVFSRRDA